jgi:hypothetical protein
MHLKGHRDFPGGQRTSPMAPFAPPPWPSPSEGEGVKKLKKVGVKVKKIVDYTYNYMLSSFYIP